MKKVSYLTKYFGLAALAAGLVLSSCNRDGCTDETALNYDADAKEDDGSCLYPTQDNITGELTENTTWSSDKIYFLEGRVVVPSGITLTIEPGTIIKGRQGQDANASALVVARGGKIMAQGTADNPIIFTSELDDIQIGQKVGSNLSKTDNELWGGVVVLGNAPTSAENGDTEANIEGIPADAGYGKYGGDNASDNSGVIQYVSIRHGGISIGEGNELNALTLGGVGNGTTVENVEIYATLDDGIECFGGTVNINNALVFYQGDDGIDLDQNYSGTISNFAVIHGDGIGTDEGLEIDGPENDTYTDGKFTLSNGIVMTEGSDCSAGDFKSGAQGTVQNVSFQGYSGGATIKIRTGFEANCDHDGDAYQNMVNGDLVFTGINSGVNAEVYDGDVEDGQTTSCPTELNDANTTANNELGIGSGGSVDYSSLFSWGAAGNNGEL